MDYEDNYKQYLKDTGCTEENIPGMSRMSKEELMDLQAAINNSKDTANLENVQRQFSQETELFPESDTPSSSQDKPVKEKSSTFKKRSQTKSPLDISDLESSQKNRLEITYHDLLESSEQQLKIIYHKPIFDLPIATNPKYAYLSVRERAKLLGDYLSKLGAARTKLAKTSLIRAQYSSPILASVKCKNSLLKRESDDESEAAGDPFDQLVSTQKFYTSRAGRQVKRKVYTESEDVYSDDDFSFSVKKPKSFESDAKITLDNVYTPEQEEEKSNSKNTKVRKDTPRRTPLGMKKGRSNVIMENSEKENSKMKQKQREMSDYMKKLTPVDEEEEKMFIDDNFSEDDHQENEERRIRISPPLFNSRKNRPKKQQSQDEDLDRIDVAPLSPASSLKKKYVIPKLTAKKQKSKENLPNEEASGSKLEMSECPICSRQFSISEIEDHAARCGEEDVVDTFLVDTGSEPPVEKIKCGICDKEFPPDASYEVHVKRCIAGDIDNM